MAKKISRNAPCPCGSGKKYKQCCLRKDFDWVEMEDGRVARSLQLPEEMVSLVEDLRQSFLAQHGREPERLFEGAPPLEHLEHWTVEAMKKAGVEPALIYAYEKTNGLLLNDRNENKVPDTDIAEWEAAISEYERKTGRKATRRRLNDQDFAAMMQHGPKDRTTAEFVERLPFPPPFEKEAWGKRHLSDIVDDPECFEYFQRCLTEVTRSGRAKVYLNMFLMMAHCGGPSDDERNYEEILQEASSRQFSVDELEQALESVALSFGPKGAIPNAAAAFEFLGFVGDFMASYAENQGSLDQLAESLQKVNGLALLAFSAAVNAELGIRDDIWRHSP
jgi:hypothetical protein